MQSLFKYQFATIKKSEQIFDKDIYQPITQDNHSQSYNGLSQEQKEYIQYNFLEKNEDTALIACAGSGKTKCMIEKLRYLVITQQLQRDQAMIFSYSKYTIEHTKSCCKAIQNSLIKTIDSFCYDIINKLGIECIVQVLSVKLLELLQSSQYEKIAKKIRKSKYGKLKAIFIDESQDLNETQYQIILKLQKILGCSLHFIGDPNQNIYQFRQSYEKYFLQHDAKRFYLSTNFRSVQQIGDFSQYFKYYVFQNSKQPQQCIDQSAVNLQINQSKENDQFVINTIKQLLAKKVKPNQIAVISPVIGDRFNTGIIRIANLLDKNQIPTVNYYDENHSNDAAIRRKSKSTKQGINLLTIHGSKGLEYHYVFLIKFSDKMMLSESFDARYIISQNMNLLYVAITRAQKQLYIIHDDSEQKQICSLINDIPQNLYTLFGSLQKHLQQIQQKIEKKQQITDENKPFTKGYDNTNQVLLIFKNQTPDYFDIMQNELTFIQSDFRWKTSVTRFIQSINQQKMLQVANYLSYKKKCQQLFDIDDKTQDLLQQIRYNKEALIGYVFEYMFFQQILSHQGNNYKIFRINFIIKDVFVTEKKPIKIAEQCIINNRNQLQSIVQFLLSLNKQDLTKEQISQTIKNIQKETCIDPNEYDNVNSDLMKNNTEFIDFDVISMNQLLIINNNRDYLFNAIQKLNSQSKWYDSISEIIYIVFVKYAVQTKHQKYINYNQKEINQIAQLYPVFKSLDNVAYQIAQYPVHYQFETGSDKIIGYLDFLVIENDKRTIIDMKVQNDLSIENIIQIIIYYVLLEEQYPSDVPTCLVIINCLKGVKYEIIINQKDDLVNYINDLIQQDFQLRISCQ